MTAGKARSEFLYFGTCYGLGAGHRAVDRHTRRIYPDSFTFDVNRVPDLGSYPEPQRPQHLCHRGAASPSAHGRSPSPTRSSRPTTTWMWTTRPTRSGWQGHPRARIGHGHPLGDPMDGGPCSTASRATGMASASPTRSWNSGWTGRTMTAWRAPGTSGRPSIAARPRPSRRAPRRSPTY
jgi:hypothetical protein